MSEILVNTIKKADGTGGLTVPAETGTVLTSGGAIDVNASAPADSLAIDASGDVGIGTSSPNGVLTLDRSTNTNADTMYILRGSGNSLPASIDTQTALLVQNRSDTFSTNISIIADDAGASTVNFGDQSDENAGGINYLHDVNAMRFKTNGNTERMRIDSSGNVMVGKTVTGLSTAGAVFEAIGAGSFTTGSDTPFYLNRQTNDGTLIEFRQANSVEGSISVSGSTVSYNGGHLARWSRLADDSKDSSIVKGTVMTNLDAMVVWSHETTYWTEDDELPVDEDGNATVSVGDVKEEAYTEENEQLNKMAVSSVEGDPNVAGVFINWDDDDDFNDMNIAMTGDMVIRIAQGTTVGRGDLLMSAGDGTAKPQGDDIVRSKTIAKVTSTNVSHTYDDGSYLVPCVLMAC